MKTRVCLIYFAHDWSHQKVVTARFLFLFSKIFINKDYVVLSLRYYGCKV